MVASKASMRSVTTPLLRWILERNGSATTCEIGINEQHRCDVAVVPHWDVDSSFIEQFDGPMRAMKRHAELAAALRADGWRVTDRA